MDEQDKQDEWDGIWGTHEDHQNRQTDSVIHSAHKWDDGRQWLARDTTLPSWGL